MGTDIRQELSEMAPFLSTLHFRDNAEVRYCMLSDAIYWADEIPGDALNWHSRFSHILRLLFRYRMTLWLGSCDDRLTDVYAIARESFPMWIGFQRMETISRDEAIEWYQMLRTMKD